MKKLLTILLFLISTSAYAQTDIRLSMNDEAWAPNKFFDVEIFIETVETEILSWGVYVGYDTTYLEVVNVNHRCIPCLKQAVIDPDNQLVKATAATDGTFFIDGGIVMSVDFRTKEVEGFTQTNVEILHAEFDEGLYTVDYEDIATITIDPMLPVELVSFEALAISNDRVKLTWRTASEINNSGFYIKRNGQFLDGVFISGSGTNLFGRAYSYTDSNVNYDASYTLVQVDLDGQNEEFGPIHVTHHENRIDFVNTYPNPFNASFSTNFVIAKAGIVNISIYNALGQMVYSVNEAFSAGPNSKIIDFDDHPSGLYMIRLQQGGQTTETKVITVMK